MKNIILKLFIVSLVVCQIWTLKTSQTQLSGKTKLELLEKKPLGKALFSMVQMKLKNGKSSGIQDLFDALETLKLNLEERKQEQQREFEQDETEHNIEVSRLEGLIQSLNEEIKTVENQISDLQTTLQTLGSDLNSQQNQLVETNNNLRDEEEFLSQLENNFQAEYLEYQEADSLLGQAESKLTEALIASQNPGQGQQPYSIFLQENSANYRQIGQSLEKKLKAVHKNLFIKPLVSYFSQLGSQTTDLDGSSLNRARDALSNLRELYQQGMVQLQEDYDAQVELHQDLLTSFKNQAANLENFVIVQTQNEISANSASLESKENQLVEAQVNLVHQNEQLVAENLSWENRVNTFYELIPKYDEQLNVVVQAEDLLRAEYPTL